MTLEYPEITGKRYPHTTACLLSLGLFVLNAWICHELFAAGFLQNLNSNEGAFTALARFFREHRSGYEWFPWFNGGMPIEFAYQPLFPALSAVIGALARWSDVKALHTVEAVSYCLTPITLFWFTWEYSKSILLSMTAALTLSVISPAAILFPVLLETGPWGDLRLYNIVHYGEGSHHLAASILPLALLFLRRGIARGGPLNQVGGAALCGITVLASPFGAVALLLGALSIVLAEGRGIGTALCMGICAWCWISPWLPPSLILQMAHGAWSAVGSFKADLRVGIADAAALVIFALVWFATRSFRNPLDRFACLFGVWMCAIPAGYFWLGISFVTFASRYQLELDIAVCLIFGIVVARGLPRAAPRLRTAALIVLVLACARQANVFRHFAIGLIHTVDIRRTIEYRVTDWIDRSMPGQRAMVGGDTKYLFNVFSNNPQFSSGHEPTAPNPVQRSAVVAIYAGDASGDRSLRDSILWLTVFGNQAVYVPGPASHDHDHDYANPGMFESVLPILWHEEDDTVYAVPQRSSSLAHVIPRAAFVDRRPHNGLDTEPVLSYAAALKDPSLPLANLAWISPSHGLIRARMDRGQMLSVQITYNRGWKARVRDRERGRDVPVRSDGLGLLAIEPGCEGDCQVELSFGATPEVWICRILSATASLAAIALLVPYFGTAFSKWR